MTIIIAVHRGEGSALHISCRIYTQLPCPLPFLSHAGSCTAIRDKSALWSHTEMA